MGLIQDLQRIKFNNLGAIGPVLRDVGDAAAQVGTAVKSGVETFDEAKALIASYARAHNVSEAQAALDLSQQGVRAGRATLALTTPNTSNTLLFVGIAVLVLYLIVRKV